MWQRLWRLGILPFTMVATPEFINVVAFRTALWWAAVPIRGLMLGLGVGGMMTLVQGHAYVQLVLTMTGSVLARYFSAKLCHFVPRAKQAPLEPHSAQACQMLFYCVCACYGMAIHPVMGWAWWGSISVVVVLVELTLLELYSHPSAVETLHRQFLTYGLCNVAVFAVLAWLIQHVVAVPWGLMEVILYYLALLTLSHTTIRPSLRILHQNTILDRHLAALHVLEARCGVLEA